MKELTERLLLHNIEVDAPAVSGLKLQAQRLGVKHLG